VQACRYQSWLSRLARARHQLYVMLAERKERDQL